VLLVPNDVDVVPLVPPVEPDAVGGVTEVLLELLPPDAVTPPLASPVVLPELLIEVDCVTVLTELVVFKLVVLLTPPDDPVLVDCCVATVLIGAPAWEFA
jgi:hypothetical protein